MYKVGITIPLQNSKLRLGLCRKVEKRGINLYMSDHKSQHSVHELHSLLKATVETLE